tara:strand:- start:351 stop:680 length:330 start_codon:yes stop_codon:yes gene_type:complete
MPSPPDKLSLPDPWPFDQPPDCAVVTTTQIMRKGEPIVHVSHDEEDHGWQFHWAGEKKMAEMLLVSLKTVIFHDPTIVEVADLPPGWRASRSAVGGPWKWEKVERAEIE